jgi:septum formation protein
MKQIILASGSARRKEILEKLGFPFEVVPSSYSEDMNQNLDPRELAKILSIGKAKDVAQNYKDAIVIGADTFISFNGKVLGKPITAEKAESMLLEMSGNCHEVVTGFTIIDTAQNKTISKSVVTKVYFKKLTKAEISSYTKSGEPLDKAGAYAIQGKGVLFVEKIEGDYLNIIGLPLSAVAEELKNFGINPWE